MARARLSVGKVACPAASACKRSAAPIFPPAGPVRLSHSSSPFGAALPCHVDLRHKGNFSRSLLTAPTAERALRAGRSADQCSPDFFSNLPICCPAGPLTISAPRPRWHIPAACIRKLSPRSPATRQSLEHPARTRRCPSAGGDAVDTAGAHSASRDPRFRPSRLCSTAARSSPRPHGVGTGPHRGRSSARAVDLDHAPSHTCCLCASPRFVAAEVAQADSRGDADLAGLGLGRRHLPIQDCPPNWLRETVASVLGGRRRPWGRGNREGGGGRGGRPATATTARPTAAAAAAAAAAATATTTTGTGATGTTTTIGATGATGAATTTTPPPSPPPTPTTVGAVGNQRQPTVVTEVA